MLPQKKSDKHHYDEEKAESANIHLISSLTGEISYNDAGGATTTAGLIYRSVGEHGDPTPGINIHIQAGDPRSNPSQNNQDDVDELQCSAAQVRPGAVRVRGPEWRESVDYDDDDRNENDGNASTATNETQPTDTFEPVASAMPIEDRFVAMALEMTDEDSILNGRTNDSKFGIVAFWGNRFRLYVAIATCLIISLAIIAGVLVGTKSGGNNSETSTTPTTSMPLSTTTQTSSTSTNPSQPPQSSTFPTFPPLIRAQIITNLTLSISGEEVLQNGTAQHEALSWILDEDPQHLSASDSRLTQRYVASLLYFQLDGENWIENKGYLTSANECDWFGVTCGEWSQNKWAIERIDLPMNLLKGKFPREISELPELRTLDLRLNLIDGTIPTEFGKMTKLFNVNLDENKLVGEIPSTIGNMANMRYFRMCCNLLTGTIPSTVSDMENVWILSMFHNFLTGSIPPSISKLESLTELRLFDNRLNGTIPAGLGNLTDLGYLILRDNELVGTVAQSICELRQGFLKELEVDCIEVDCSCCTNC